MDWIGKKLGGGEKEDQHGNTASKSNNQRCNNKRGVGANSKIWSRFESSFDSSSNIFNSVIIIV